jgi:hypothetical protein
MAAVWTLVRGYAVPVAIIIVGVFNTNNRAEPVWRRAVRLFNVLAQLVVAFAGCPGLLSQHWKNFFANPTSLTIWARFSVVRGLVKNNTRHVSG